MPTRRLLSPVQMESLTSPVRIAIVQRLEIDSSSTASDLARRMGRSVTTLYHHLNHLEEVGILRIVGVRPGARRPEAVYALAADVLSSAATVKTAEGRKAYARTAARVADAGARALAAAIESGAVRFEGKPRNAMVRYYALRASPEKLARLNRLLEELEETALGSSDDGEEIQLSILLSPMPAKG